MIPDSQIVATLLPDGYIGSPDNAVSITMLGEDVADMGAKSSRPSGKSDEDQNPRNWAAWGSCDDWPTQLRIKAEASTIGIRSLYMAAAYLYGIGPAYYRLEIDEDGKMKKVFFQDEEIDDFWRNNDIPCFLYAQCISWAFFKNNFQEFIFSKDKRRIVRLSHLDSEYSRLPTYVNGSEQMDFLRFSTKFAKMSGYQNISDKDIRKIPLLDKVAKTTFIKKLSGAKFANHTKLPGPGRFTYAMPYHGGLFRDKGWIDVSNKVPEAIYKLVCSQVVIKYQIKIPDNYWGRMFPPSEADGGWPTYTREQKNAIIKKKFGEMDKFLKQDNTLGIFKSHYQVDPNTGKSINEGWIITAIDDKIKDDAWIPSADAADKQIVRTIGIDTSVSLGSSGGGSIGAGSGSDKRVGDTNTYNLFQPEEYLIFEPLRIVRDINGWDKNIHFTFLRNQPTRLDQNPTGSETTS